MNNQFRYGSLISNYTQISVMIHSPYLIRSCRPVNDYLVLFVTDTKSSCKSKPQWCSNLAFMLKRGSYTRGCAGREHHHSWPIATEKKRGRAISSRWEILSHEVLKGQYSVHTTSPLLSITPSTSPKWPKSCELPWERNKGTLLSLISLLKSSSISSDCAAECNESGGVWWISG